VARFKRVDVFVDVCTQTEYLSTNGIRRCNNAEQVAGNLKHLMAYARWAHVPVLSCVDTRRPNHIGDDQALNHSLCKLEQKKARFGLLPGYTVVECDNRLCISLKLLETHQQAIFTKDHRDPFTNPKLDRLLTEMPVKRFVVFGVPLESSIRILVLGLLLRHRKVAVVNDACGFWNRDEADMALRQLGVKGCELLSTDQLVHSARGNGNGRPNGRNGNGRRRA
jgi:nicotinamidase-related amidase